MTTTAAVTNYGILFKKGATLIGEVTNWDGIELTNEAIEATYHQASPNNWREFIASGLKSLSETKATINYIANGIDTLVTDLSAGTKSTYTVTFPNADVVTMTALVTKIKPMSSDAMSPDTMKAEVTFMPSGSGTIT